MNLLEKNLNNLFKVNPDLAKTILDHTELLNHAEFQDTKCGDVNLIYNGVPLHDDIDALEQATELTRKIELDKESINIFFGFGLGYHLSKAVDRTQGIVVVIEHNIDVLRVAFEILDLTPLFEKGRFIIINDYRDLKDKVNSFICENTKLSLTFLPSYYKLYPALLNEIKEEANIISGLIKVSFNTVNKSIFLWTKSSLLNIHKVLQHKEIEAIRNKFKDKPAIIVSAGPSLDKTIDKIKENQDKFVIFCVGSAASALYKNGIKPDFVIAIESGDCYGQISDLPIENLITIPSAHPKLHTANANRIWNYYPNNMPDVYWMKKQGFIDFEIEDYNNSGSVSFIGLYSAIIAGCNPLILTGQDLAFIDGQCYTKDSKYKVQCEYDKEANSYQIKPLDFDEYNKVNYNNEVPESMNKEVKELFKEASQNIYFVDGQDGKKLPTDGGYVTFIKHFEEIARKNKGKIKLINCSPGGAQIIGYENLAIDDVCKTYANEQIDKEFIIEKSLKSFRNLQDGGISKNFHNSLRSLYDNYKRLYRYASEIREKGHEVRCDVHLNNASYQKIYKGFQKVCNLHQKCTNIIKNIPFLSIILDKELKELKEKLDNNSETDEIMKLDYITLWTFWFSGTVLFQLEDIITALDKATLTPVSYKK